MDELSRAMEDLKVHNEHSKLDQCLDTFLQILDSEDLDHDTTTKNLLDQGILTELSGVLQSPTSNKAKTAQVIAELAKTEEARVPCVTAGVVPVLLDMLAQEDTQTLTQACRALGNICFDNDSARNLIAEKNGVQTIVDLLKNLLNQTADGASTLRRVACGLLLNVTNTHETVQEKAVSLGAMQVLADYLSKHACDEGVVQMALLSVGSLAESDTGKQALASCPVVETIVQLLGTEVGEDLQESILELLTSLAESDDIKVLLAKSDLSQRVLALLQRSGGEVEDERVQTEKMVSDLVVLVLTGDESMEVMYSSGEGQIYKESLNWLNSQSDQLRISGALAIGNFARNDSHCTRLVHDGITARLLKLLEAVDSDPTLQHAVLSALRNLAIPAANKPVMLKCRLLEHLLPHINTEFPFVQFKLLGTLRMAIDNQAEAAKSLGTNEEFLTKLVTWCTAEDEGVKGEANRLVSWVIKHSRSSDVMSAVCKHEGVPHLVTMATSVHAVMQNEALVALTHIATSVLGENDTILAQSELVPTIKVLLTEKDTLAEIMCNTLTLVKSLSQSAEIYQLMKVADLHKTIRDLQKHEETIVSNQAKDVASVFSKG